LTSDRQRRANQDNAKASTGPKTRAGKERAAQNGLRHGLSIPVSSDPALSPQAEAIARRIAGPNAKAEALEQARRIGEAQVDLNRVRARRVALVADPLEHAIGGKSLEGFEKLAIILQAGASELARLDRYERRALSRRKSAIREFDSVRPMRRLQIL
jgi:hypothetical protein